jgi:hypothetical protein
MPALVAGIHAFVRAADLLLRRGRGLDHAIRAVGACIARRQQPEHLVRPGELSVVASCSFIVGCGSFLRGRVDPNVDRFAVEADFYHPFRTALKDALESRTIALVARILMPGRLAQIRDAVVGPISVFMIDLSRRMLAMHIEPCEAVGEMRDSVDDDHSIAVHVISARFGARGHATPRCSPIKKPRFRDVMEHFAQPVRAQAELFFTRHEDLPFKKESARQPIEAPGAIRPS